MRHSLQLVLKSIRKLKSKSGFSVVEVLVSVGILSIIGAGVSTLAALNQQNTVQFKATRIAMTQKEKIQAALKNPASWQVTLTSNPNFSCLNVAPGCDDTEKNFILYSVDPIEKLTFDPADSTTRLTLKGESCPAGTPDPSPKCPLKYIATWKALCTTFPCLNPPIDLKIELQTAFEDDRKILNTQNYDYKTIKGINDNDVESICISMNGVYNAINKTCRPKFAGRSCAAMGRPHQIVKDVLANGSLLCEPLFTGMCPGAQVVVGINVNGSAICGAQPGSCPVPVNCVGSWSPCTAACGMTAVQTYTVTTAAAFGGLACPAANGATQMCSGPVCAVNQNCVGSFGACNAVTGLRTYTQTVPQLGAGTACPHSTGFTQACAVNCVGGWGVCSGGTQTFSQSITAKNGGLACAAAHGATQACGAIVVNGSCSPTKDTCVTGLANNFGSTPTHDTWQCQGSGGGSTASCSSPKAVNCVGSWNACPVTCGGGTQTYTVTTPASGGGSSCPYVTGDTQACSPAPCAANIDCVGDFGACNASTGTRIYTITQPQSGTGAICPFATGFVQNCPVNCVGAFGACSGGSRTYVQSITAKNGGTACGYAHGFVDICGLNGLCNLAVVDSCTAGTFIHLGDPPTQNLWACAGSGGGSTDTCVTPKTPVFGGCSYPPGIPYGCISGTSASQTSWPLVWRWTCLGSNGGTNASCEMTKPPVVPSNTWVFDSVYSCFNGPVPAWMVAGSPPVSSLPAKAAVFGTACPTSGAYIYVQGGYRFEGCTHVDDGWRVTRLRCQ